jgi:antitoxin component YwqK of YwqJK toxin-antitoxin module
MIQLDENLKKILLISFLTLFIFNCGEKVREEVTDRYDDGKIKTLMKFIGKGSEEVMVEKISYSQSGDTLILEKTLDKIQMVRKYYNNGQKSEEGMLKDGKENGKWTWYYISGNIHEELNYKNGKGDGKYIAYYENGQIEEEGHFKSGEIDGVWIWYYSNGQIWREGNYKNDILADYTWYYSSGEIMSKGNYKNEEKDGKWIFYNEDGSIDKIEEYKVGKLVVN